MTQSPSYPAPAAAPDPQRQDDRQRRLALALAIAHQQQAQEDQRNASIAGALLLGAATLGGGAYALSRRNDSAKPQHVNPPPRYDSRNSSPVNTYRNRNGQQLSPDLVPVQDGRGLGHTSKKGSLNTRPGFNSYAVPPKSTQQAQKSGQLDQLPGVASPAAALQLAQNATNPNAAATLKHAAAALESSGELHFHLPGVESVEQAAAHPAVIGNRDQGIAPLPLGSFLHIEGPAGIDGKPRSMVYQVTGKVGSTASSNVPAAEQSSAETGAFDFSRKQTRTLGLEPASPNAVVAGWKNAGEDGKNPTNPLSVEITGGGRKHDRSTHKEGKKAYKTLVLDPKTGEPITLYRQSASGKTKTYEANWENDNDAAAVRKIFATKYNRAVAESDLAGREFEAERKLKEIEALIGGKLSQAQLNHWLTVPITKEIRAKDPVKGQISDLVSEYAELADVGVGNLNSNSSVDRENRSLVTVNTRTGVESRWEGKNQNDQTVQEQEYYYNESSRGAQNEIARRVADIASAPENQNRSLRAIALDLVASSAKNAAKARMIAAHQKVANTLGVENPTHAQARQLRSAKQETGQIAPLHNAYDEFLAARNSYAQFTPTQIQEIEQQAAEIAQRAEGILKTRAQRPAARERRQQIGFPVRTGQSAAGGDAESVLKGLLQLPPSTGTDFVSAAATGDSGAIQRIAANTSFLGKRFTDAKGREDVFKAMSDVQLANHIAADALPRVIQAGLNSPDPAIRSMAQKYQIAGYETTFGPEVMDQLLKRIDPLIAMQSDIEKRSGNGPSVGVAHIGQDRAELLALDILDGQDEQLLLNQLMTRAGAPQTTAHAVLNLLHDNFAATSENTGLPHVNANVLVQHFFDTMDPQQAGHVGQLMQSFDELSNAGYGRGANDSYNPVSLSRVPIGIGYGQRYRIHEGFGHSDVTAGAGRQGSPLLPQEGSAEPGNLATTKGQEVENAPTQRTVNVNSETARVIASERAMPHWKSPKPPSAFVAQARKLAGGQVGQVNGILQKKVEALTRKRFGLPLDQVKAIDDEIKGHIETQARIWSQRAEIETTLHQLNRRAVDNATGGKFIYRSKDLHGRGNEISIGEIGDNITNLHGNAYRLDQNTDEDNDDGAFGRNETVASDVDPYENAELIRWDEENEAKRVAQQARGTIKGGKMGPQLPANEKDHTRLVTYNQAQRDTAEYARRQQALALAKRFQADSLGAPAAVTPTIMEERNAAAYNATQDQEALRQRAAATAAIMDERVASAARERPATWLGVVKNGAVVPGSGVQGPSELYLQARMRAMFGPRGRR